MEVPKKILARQHEITSDFSKAVDKHLEDLMQNNVLDMMEIQDFAEQMHIHPTHLSNTIKLTTGKSPCDLFEEKIMRIAKDMLQNTNLSIAEIARQLTFDPSNFTKFFKRFGGTTPKQFREQALLKQYEQAS